MSSVKIAGDTSGVITLTSPAAAGTNTITMPASTGTMALTGDIPGATTNASDLVSGTLPMARLSGTLPALNGSALTNLAAGNIATGTVPTARLGSGTASSSTFLRGDSTYAEAGGGKILQVVSQVVTTKFATTSSSFVDTGITLAITPAATSSKILVQMQGMFGTGGGGENNFFQVLRGSTQLGLQMSIMQDGVTQNFPRTVVFLDSPGTASAVTYKVQVKAGGNEVFMNRDNSDNQMGFSTITLLEVGA